MSTANQINKGWIENIKKALVGKKIVDITLMPKEEMELRLWGEPTPIFHLDDGNIFYPSTDDEGNGPGAIFTSIDGLEVIPVLCNE